MKFSEEVMPKSFPVSFPVPPNLFVIGAVNLQRTAPANPLGVTARFQELEPL
jgi:hypothetical protein